jgi:glycosyltransferase involved in cell wall biosynthesis
LLDPGQAGLTSTRPIVLFYKQLTTLGGAEVLLGEHYAHLKTQGCQVKVVCFGHGDVARVNIAPCDLLVTPGRGSIAQTLRLAQQLRRLRPAHVYCHSGHIECGLAAGMARVKYSVFMHQPTTMSYNETDKYAPWFFERYKAFARKDRMYDRLIASEKALGPVRKAYVSFRALLSQWAQRRASSILVLSDYAVREKREVFGLSAIHRSGAIPRGRIAALASKAPVLSPRSEATLVTLSRLDENKRIDLLLEAVALLVARGRSMRLLIGGSGPSRAKLEAQTAALGLADSVDFLGYVPEEDIARIYESMDLFVTIDWADFRITTYEVLAENRRVVVSDDTDIDASLLSSGYLFASPADAEALATTIEQALASTVSWSKETLADYLDRYSWETYFTRIDDLVGAYA